MISGEVARAIKLILVTAQRPGEVAGMHTSEIDGIWWTIPSERAKNGKAHRVPLSPLAREIIEESIKQNKESREIPEDQNYTGYIFPCPHRAKDKPIERHALSKALKRNQSEDGLTVLGVASFTPHDLRRTAATFMAESGEMDEVIDAVLKPRQAGHHQGVQPVQIRRPKAGGPRLLGAQADQHRHRDQEQRGTSAASSTLNLKVQVDHLVPELTQQ